MGAWGLRAALVMAVLASATVSAGGREGAGARVPEHLVLFPPIANATEQGARRRQLPREAMYAHGHDIRPPKSRDLAEEEYVCFRSPAVVSLKSGRVLLAFVEGRRLSCHEHGGPHHILLRTSVDGGRTWSYAGPVAAETDGRQGGGGVEGSAAPDRGHVGQVLLSAARLSFWPVALAPWARSLHSYAM